MLSEYNTDYREMANSANIISDSKKIIFEQKAEQIKENLPIFSDFDAFSENRKEPEKSSTILIGKPENIIIIKKRYSLIRGTVCLTLALFGVIFICCHVSAHQIGSLAKECFVKMTGQG